MKIFFPHGFTLIELIIVIGVTGILAVVMTDVLTQTLRGQNKVKIINQIKQNGQSVLEKMTNEIRQAERVVCVGKITGSSGPDNTLVIFKNGVYTRFRFEPGLTGQNGKITAQSWGFESQSNDCTAESSVSEPLLNLTDTDTKNGISIEPKDSEPIFTPDPKPGYNDNITIKFKATAGVEAGEAYEASVKEGGVLFTTSVGVKGG
ncbi:MAG: type II secretion system protein [Candidatus Daviesbacteria bacterium]